MSLDEQFMRAALEAAAQSQLINDVNPRVGAVITSSTGEVLATGYHRGSGTVHAEVDALSRIGDAARGATIYSTLEPCNSTGRMGPCTQALINAGVARVVFAQTDPNVTMAGGAQTLRDAGIEVVSGVLADDARALNRTWTFMQETGRPWVTWKVATTLDGFTAASDGSSKWITSEEARERVQHIRASVGAIVTGTGTVLADNPALTVRSVELEQHPRRIVVGTRDVSSADMFIGDNPAEVMCGDIADVLAELAREGVHHVLVEAGQGLAKSLWAKDLVDEVYWFLAPVVLGSGQHAIGDLGVSALSDARRFQFSTVNRVGLDLEIHFSLR